MERQDAVGVVGVGAIGSRMARRLRGAGYKVVCYDLRPEVFGPLADEEIEQVASAAEVAEHCRTIITCVTDDRTVEDAVLGPRGLKERLRPDTVVIETTTSTPAMTRKVAGALAEAGGSVIDAPVSRGVPAAENGTLSFMIGGDAAVIDGVLPILAPLGTDIVRTGALGTGHAAKAMNMLVMGITLAATAEATAIADAAGETPEAFIARLNAGPARSFMSANHFPKYVLSKHFDSTFTLGLMHKDIRLGLGIADAVGEGAPLSRRVEAIYAEAAVQGLGPQDNTLVVPFIGRRVLAPARRPLPAGNGIGAALEGWLAETIRVGVEECSRVGAAAGLDPRRLLEVLAVSSGGCRAAEDAAEPLADVSPAWRFVEKAGLKVDVLLGEDPRRDG